jgi:inorganic pyrophosphatase
MPTVRVFIENTAGSCRKHHHDEETFRLLRVEEVSGPYPFPYGFAPGTRAPDGDCVDCLVITDRPLRTGEFVECEPVALMEQTEGGVVDHKVLVVLVSEPAPDLQALVPVLTEAMEQLFAGMPGREAVVGRFLPASAAWVYIGESRLPDSGK